MTLTETVSHALDASDNPENEALQVFHYLMERFGWAGTVMTRQDAEDIADRALTDSEWSDVANTRSWRKAGNNWGEVGVTWDSVEFALYEAGIIHKGEEKA